MTEPVASTEAITNNEESAKALLARLAIEARYRSPNGGYVSTFNKNVSKKESEIVAQTDLVYSAFTT
jgi:hypothetical protein